MYYVPRLTQYTNVLNKFMTRLFNLILLTKVVVSGSRLDDWQPLPFTGGFDFSAHMEGSKKVVHMFPLLLFHSLDIR